MRYEDLRAAALGIPGTRHALGLFLFQRDGMMTWLQALAPPSSVVNGSLLGGRPEDALPSLPTVREEVVHVLANLVVREHHGGLGIEPRTHHP